MSEGFYSSLGSKFHAHIESAPDPFNSHERIKNDINVPAKNRELSVALFPNPFHEYLNISVTSSYSTSVSIDLYDNMGRLVKRLLNNAIMEKGTSNLILNHHDVDLRGGVYYCIVTTANERKSVKMIFID